MPLKLYLYLKESSTYNIYFFHALENILEPDVVQFQSMKHWSNKPWIWTFPDILH